MEALLERPVVVGFAVAGGVFSVAAMLLRNKGGQALARQVDRLGYVLMGISMLLFIVVGFRGQA